MNRLVFVVVVVLAGFHLVSPVPNNGGGYGQGGGFGGGFGGGQGGGGFFGGLFGSIANIVDESIKLGQRRKQQQQYENGQYGGGPSYGGGGPYNGGPSYGGGGPYNEGPYNGGSNGGGPYNEGPYGGGQNNGGQNGGSQSGGYPIMDMSARRGYGSRQYNRYYQPNQQYYPQYNGRQYRGK
ncbi:heterogeneous nuclear ribonucleoprotein A3 homolog 2-like [Drosophila kikkawai]|uniref:Heterogeneous nuclear ribonucleoprotein A3 homolog 2-like n=1 Tax=Drosophila kikkawai TaxID=30033 RepID=A0A6P4IVP3_DROKI|nr:acanthoscurrin-1-like [Drosophila kikkawai]